MRRRTGALRPFGVLTAFVPAEQAARGRLHSLDLIAPVSRFDPQPPPGYPKACLRTPEWTPFVLLFYDVRGRLLERQRTAYPSQRSAACARALEAWERRQARREP
jgi:hypothetical protein